jgi:uncharacterized membrane protein
MNRDDVIDVPIVTKVPPASNTPGALGDSPDESLKTWGWVSYILHLIVAVAAVVPGAQPSIVLLLVAQIGDWIKRDDAAGTWQASHFSWRIRTVLWAGLWYVVTAPLWLLMVPGWIAWTLISVWFLYRIVKGMERLNANQPIVPHA